MDPHGRLTCILLVTLVACVAGAKKYTNRNGFMTWVLQEEPSGWIQLDNVGTPRAGDIAENVLLPQEHVPVNLRYPSTVLFGRTCGGTIISPTWILTAAHCTLFTNGLQVLAGTNNTENGSGVQAKVKRLVVHPLFTVGPYWLNVDKYNIKQVAARWDFMLAELESPLTLDGIVIAAAELDTRARLPSGEKVGYAGYGAEKHGETMRSEMHAMDLQILSDADCSTLEQYNPQDMLCVVGIPPRYDSACNGDSGSGLIKDGRVLGVASWVEDDAVTCAAGKRVVFSRVAAARDWIKKVTNI